MKIGKTLKKKYPALFYWYVRTKQRCNKLIVSDRQYVEKKFAQRFGMKPDLTNPRRYNEQVSRILLTQPTRLMVKCADKYEVRSYVEEKAGKDLLNELNGVFSDLHSLRDAWPEFPDSFVLKATHGSAWNYICKDKAKADQAEVELLVKHWLKSNFYYAQREQVYKTILPRIICEKYLEDDSGGLTDYKVHCFNGQPRFLHMAVGRYTNMIYNTYDLEGNYMDVEFFKGKVDKALPLNRSLPLDRLLDLSKRLSGDFPYVRADFYCVGGRIIFSELTFTPGNGHFDLPLEIDLVLGSYFK